MDCKTTLFKALTRGEFIKGNGDGLSKELLLCGKDDLEAFVSAPFFPHVMAEVWRNREVMDHVDKMIKFSVYLHFEIVKRVKLTEEERLLILENVMDRIEVTELDSLNRLLNSDSKTLVAATEELWRKVFVRL